jgi:CelD/BcsL family acetyltransferase involved in cellulose biosynthesis
VVLAVPREGWERGRVALKFQLGDFVLGSAGLSLFRRSAGLDEKPLAEAEAPEPPHSLDGADGYVVWSHPIAARRPVLSRQPSAVLYSPRQYRRFSTDLTGDFEQYVAKFSGKTRSTLKRKLRKFTEASGGAIDWREYRTAPQIDAFFPLARQVSSKTYQERLLSAGLPGDEAFVDAARAGAQADNVRAYLLFLNGEPISYLFCPVAHGVVVYDHLGYDPGYSALSPGTVLQTLALQALFAERRFTLFDFTEGEGQHKEMFATHSRLCADVYVVTRRLAPLSIVMLHRVTDKASAAAGALLDRLELRAGARRLLRRLGAGRGS